MKIKTRLIGKELNSQDIFPTLNKIAMGTKFLVEKFPVNTDIGVLTIIENFNTEKNTFQVVIKNKNNEELIRGSFFRCLSVTENNEAILLYNVKGIYLEKRADFYIVEVMNENIIFDSFKISAEIGVENIYQLMNSSGSISL